MTKSFINLKKMSSNNTYLPYLFEDIVDTFDDVQDTESASKIIGKENDTIEITDMVCSPDEQDNYRYTVKISLTFSEHTNLDYNNLIDVETNFINMRGIIEGIQDTFDMTPIFTDYEISNDVFLLDKNLEKEHWEHVYSKPLTDKINLAREYEDTGQPIFYPILIMTIRVFCNIIEEQIEFDTFARLISRFDRMMDFRLKNTGKFGTNNRTSVLIYDNNASDKKYSINTFSLNDIRGATRLYKYLYDRENLSNSWDLSQKNNWPVVADILEGIDLRKSINKRLESIQRKYCVDIEMTACADSQLRQAIKDHDEVSNDSRKRLGVMMAFTVNQSITLKKEINKSEMLKIVSELLFCFPVYSINFVWYCFVFKINMKLNNDTPKELKHIVDDIHLKYPERKEAGDLLSRKEYIINKGKRSQITF